MMSEFFLLHESVLLSSEKNETSVEASSYFFLCLYERLIIVETVIYRVFAI